MNKMIAFTVVLASLLLLTLPTGQAADRAEDILAATGLNGGLIVHLGCGDGKLTGELLANDSFLVHGLDADAANVAEARQHLHELGLYGKVSIDQFDGQRLPYIDNLVNLLVADELGDVHDGRGDARAGTAGRGVESAARRPSSRDRRTSTTGPMPFTTPAATR